MLTVQQRKRVIAISKRRVQSGSGSQKWRAGLEVFVVDLSYLCKLFGDVPFLVVGGRATRYYMPERMTMDTDVLVAVSEEGEVRNALVQFGAQCMGTLAIPGETWRLPGGEMLDVLFAHTSWMERALLEPKYDADHLPVIGLSWLVLMKLKSSRMQDIADITRMLGAADEANIAAVKKVISEYAPDDLSDVESMIQIGRMEYL